MRPRAFHTVNATLIKHNFNKFYPSARCFSTLHDPTLEEHDPEMYELLQAEQERQRGGLELIASENFTSTAVMQCLGSSLTNKYAEGYPSKRYYGGNQVIDKIERLCQDRALETYGLDKNEWAVNVQPYSGSPANFGVYTAILNPHDRIMGPGLADGGHLTHGHYTLNKKTGERKKISATSIYFESLPYQVDSETGYMDYKRLAEVANVFKPKLVICGGSAYPRDWDYETIREVCDSNGSYMMTDMSHFSGLVATGVVKSPFELSDIVTTTTHKSLRGPRAGMIFSKRDERKLPDRIDQAVFPGLQGGPHEHQIAGIATQLKQVQTPEFKTYIEQVVSNSRSLAKKLVDLGYTLATGGTDTHLLLWDLRPQGLTGNKVEFACDLCHITLNKNSVPGDVSALSPGGVRIGAPAMTTRQLKENDFEKVGEFLHRVVKICLKVQEKSGKKMVEFRKHIVHDEELKQLANDVNAFSKQFPMPGIYH
eukprot:maker-scaffold_11-snap-gene-12.6-mRNA-1 protein AED:0.12 eAED:0.12 QI:107/1/1/1/1/1/2/270/481